MRARWILAGLLASCAYSRESHDAGSERNDGARPDAQALLDAAASDASSQLADAHGFDAAWADADLTDANLLDASSIDSGSPDGSIVLLDAGTAMDGGSDAGRSGGCISGAPGSLALRFRWLGSSPGSTAYVDYERNDLPDTSRWHVSANDMSFSYTPIFDDTFLAEGGLDLELGAFIDVELSTAGLSGVRSVTLAIYGRSFDTTTSGSFTWQTFDGVGAAEADSVSNVAPYAWYAADATGEILPGESTALLRIRPGPSSDALIVARVEICFEID